MKKFYFCLFFLFFHAILYSQYTLSGTVVNANDGSPLTGASVFINGGSNGTVSNREGQFVLQNISFNSFELVVSYVSFETIVVKISADNINKRFRIQMAPKENELQEVIVGAVERDGWKKWGKLFTEFFIGTSNIAAECILTNPEVLRFRFSKKADLLTVSSVDQLIIKNNALGYTINYQLENFVYDFRKKITTYLGYSSFMPMQSHKRKMNQWINNRKEAYTGSMMHFMRSLYANKLEEEGFRLTSLIRYNSRDSSTRDIYNRIMSGDYRKVDTANYYIQVLRPEGSGFGPTIIYLIGKKLLPAGAIRKADSLNRVSAYFDNLIELVYTKEFERPEYVAQSARLSKQRRHQTSLLYFTNNRPVVIEENGIYFEPLDLFTEGYIAWEKIAEMLPTDYQPGD